MKNALNKFSQNKKFHHHDKKHKSTFFEVALLIIIVVITLTRLISWEEPKIIIYLIPLLTIVFLFIKVRHILKEGGTILEDYTTIIIILIFLGLYIILKGEINSALALVFIFMLIYSTGLMIWLKTRITSKKITHFIVSYITTIILTILLFAGAYTSGTGSFMESGQQLELKFRDAIYFSAVTFTTVGYGDIVPLGINRAFAAIEALLGITINTALIGYILASGKNNGH